MARRPCFSAFAASMPSAAVRYALPRTDRTASRAKQGAARMTGSAVRREGARGASAGIRWSGALAPPCLSEHLIGSLITALQHREVGSMVSSPPLRTIANHFHRVQVVQPGTSRYQRLSSRPTRGRMSGAFMSIRMSIVVESCSDCLICGASPSGAPRYCQRPLAAASGVMAGRVQACSPVSK